MEKIIEEIIEDTEDNIMHINTIEDMLDDYLYDSPEFEELSKKIIGKVERNAEIFH